MFIMGNAPQLSAKSAMWRSIIQELKEQGSVGDGWPIGCTKHRNATKATRPGDIDRFAPIGKPGLWRVCTHAYLQADVKQTGEAIKLDTR